MSLSLITSRYNNVKRFLIKSACLDGDKTENTRKVDIILFGLVHHLL
jgi:hypothetical protein